jgi:CheY-like chemotaxis protein
MTVEPRRCHVHVIDDAPTILDLMRELLEEEGLQVSTRCGAPSDLSEIKALKPSLIILDCLRPGQAAGWSLLQTLKLDRDTCAIPIVLCTAAARRVKALECDLAALNVAVVLKPFDINELVAVITESLRSCAETSSTLSGRMRASPESRPQVQAVPPMFTDRSPRFTATATLRS